MEQIKKFLGEETAARATEFRSLLSEQLRLSILGLLSPTLKRLGAPERQKLALAVKALVAADGKLDLFELAACQVLKKPLGANFVNDGPNSSSINGYLVRLQEDTVMVLSALAYLGSSDQEEAGRAFAAGLTHFNQWPLYGILSKHQVTSVELARALDRFNQVPEKIKHQLILAAVSTALYTQQVTDKEYQLLRALAAALDVPLPLMAGLDMDGPAAAEIS